MFFFAFKTHFSLSLLIKRGPCVRCRSKSNIDKKQKIIERIKNNKTNSCSTYTENVYDVFVCLIIHISQENQQIFAPIHRANDVHTHTHTCQRSQTPHNTLANMNANSMQCTRTLSIYTHTHTYGERAIARQYVFGYTYAIND